VSDFFHVPHPGNHQYNTGINYVLSYGSVIATHLLHTPYIAQKLGPILFVDPVSFLLHLPDVAYNFVRPPTVPLHNPELISLNLDLPQANPRQ
jgi:hypothetical protein